MEASTDSSYWNLPASSYGHALPKQAQKHPELPDEVWFQILEPIPPRYLGSLSRVSKQLRSLCLPLLYEDCFGLIYELGEKSGRSEDLARSFSNNSGLCSFVHATYFRGDELSISPSLLPFCTSLDTLSIICDLNSSLSCLASLLDNPSSLFSFPEKVTRLEIRTKKENGSATVMVDDVFDQILGLLPNVHSLSISRNALVCGGYTVHKLVQRDWKSLHLAANLFINVQCTETFLSRSCNSLTHLQISEFKDESYTFLKGLASFPNLVYLFLTFSYIRHQVRVDDIWEEDVPAILSLFRKLETVGFSSIIHLAEFIQRLKSLGSRGMVKHLIFSECRDLYDRASYFDKDHLYDFTGFLSLKSIHYHGRHTSDAWIGRARESGIDVFLDRGRHLMLGQCDCGWSIPE